jgi:putative nucleotidyltransferase with HDIG domain
VLLVDDDAIVRDVMSAWLADQGYECAGVAGAAAALECASVHAFEVAVLNLRLPDGDGAALARKLKAANADLAVVMVVGAAPFWECDQAVHASEGEFLQKPFTRDEMVQAVERAMWKRVTARSQSLNLAHLEQVINERAAQLSRRIAMADTASNEGLEGLVVDLNRSNPGAAQHALRVADSAEAVARMLELEETEVVVIRRAALLHDIGKLAIPDALMCKPSALTTAEINLIRSHPRVGYAILSPIPALGLVADVVVSSHEAWDGTGYPAGLSRNDIPIGARVVAVADTYDALTWALVLGGPVPRVRAAAELVRCAGTLFDPAVVAAWLRVLDTTSELGPRPTRES